MGQPRLTIVEHRTTEPAWCCRTTLTTGVEWHEVVARHLCDTQGREIEPWIEVRGVAADASHRPLAAFGLEPQPLLIQC